MIVAIDGPAASGKGTLGRRLAERFGETLSGLRTRTRFPVEMNRKPDHDSNNPPRLDHFAQRCHILRAIVTGDEPGRKRDARIRIRHRQSDPLLAEINSEYGPAIGHDVHPSPGRPVVY